jgi:hypothetical protein
LEEKNESEESESEEDDDSDDKSPHDIYRDLVSKIVEKEFKSLVPF